jgi:hypothetical protein
MFLNISAHIHVLADLRKFEVMAPNVFTSGKRSKYHLVQKLPQKLPDARAGV